MSRGKPPDVLRCLARLYTSDGPLSLRALSDQLGVPIGAPPQEAVVLVVGDPGSGKSAFVNALVEELVLTVGPVPPQQQRRRPPVEWVSSDAAAAGTAPRLLLEAARQFPGWLSPTPGGISACCSSCCMSPQLDGVDFVEATPHRQAADLEALSWLAARVDVIVCLLDSQRQPVASEPLLQWLSQLPCVGQASATKVRTGLQFVLSKSDLTSRESDRIRLLAKASRLLTDRLGRGFEILPVATGDLELLLDGTGLSVKLSRCHTAQPDAPGQSTAKDGALRAVLAARECAARRAAEGLRTLEADSATLVGTVEARLIEARARQRAEEGSSPVRVKLLQISGAMVIVAAALPAFLDEDIEPWVARACAGTAVAVAVLLLVLAAILPAEGGVAPKATAAGEQVAMLAEHARFLNLLSRQCWRWHVDEQPSKEAAFGVDDAMASTTPLIPKAEKSSL